MHALLQKEWVMSLSSGARRFWNGLVSVLFSILVIPNTLSDGFNEINVSKTEKNIIVSLHKSGAFDVICSLICQVRFKRESVLYM